MRNLLISILIAIVGILIYLLDTLLLQNHVMILELRALNKEMMVSEAAMSDLADVLEHTAYPSYSRHTN